MWFIIGYFAGVFSIFVGSWIGEWLRYHNCDDD